MTKMQRHMFKAPSLTLYINTLSTTVKTDDSVKATDDNYNKLCF